MTLAPDPPDPSTAWAMLDATLQQLPVGVILAAAPDGRIVASNARVAEVLGDAAPARRVDDWRGFRPDGRPYAAHESPLARAILRGETTAGEPIVLERPDGSRVTTEVRAAPVRDAAGAVVGGVVVLEDVSARAAADAARRASEERYALAARAVSNAIWDWDVTANTVRWNPGVYEVFGYPPGTVEETADWWYDHIHPEDRERVVDGIHAVIDDPTAGTAWRDAYRFRRGDGRYADVIDRGYVARHTGPDGRPGRAYRMVGAMADVTAERAASARLAQLHGAERALRAEAERERAEADVARRAAERAAQAKGEFLATMSHELRTPINAITGYAQLLDLGVAGPLTPGQRDYLARLSASGRHLLGLVDDVLDVAKLDAGRVSVMREALPAAGAAAAALAVVLPLAEAKRVRLVDATGGDTAAGDTSSADRSNADGSNADATNGDSSDGDVAGGLRYVGDEHRVRQVLINLLSNAVKFTPAGGTVELACALVREAPPAVRVEGGGPWLAFAVRDTGPGVPPERQAAVFEPFVQAEAGHTRAHGGTGLGLTISRRLARLMGGDVTLAGRVEGGSTFTLWLPALAPALAPAAPPTLAPTPAPGTSTEAAAPDARARREVAGFRVRGLREVSDRLREHLEEVLEHYLARLRGDAVTAPSARGRTRADLEDHALSFVSDLMQALGILDGGAEAERAMLQDGADVQRLLAERHGRQRHRLGFTVEQLAREYELLGEVLAEAVRRYVPPHVGDVGAALAALDRLVRRAAEHSLRGYRRAAAEGTGEHAAVGRGRGA